jgi:hypothetical protein
MVPYTDLEDKTVQNTINYANCTKRCIVPYSSTEPFLGGTVRNFVTSFSITPSLPQQEAASSVEYLSTLKRSK